MDTFVFYIMKKKLILLLFPLLASCNGRHDIVENEIVADINVEIVPRNDTISLSSIYENKFNVLTLDSIVLASINKVLRYNSLWVVEGKSKHGGVHLFDNNGHYMHTLLNWGQGPDEATDIWAMKIFQDAVYLLVNSGTELIKYSLSTQKIEWRFKLPNEIISATDFEIIHNNKFIFLKSVSRELSSKECKLYIYNNMNNQIEGRMLELDKKASEYISFSQSDCLYRFQNHIRYYEVFRNGICEIECDSLSGYLGFKSNKYTFSEDELYMDSYTFETFIEACRSSKYIWGHCNLYEGKRFISSTYNYNNDLYWNLVDKLTNSSKSYKWVNDDLIFNEISLVEDYLFRINVQNDCHYFALSYYDLDRMIQKMDKEKISSRLMRLYKRMDDGSNDLVICFHEKK